MSHILCNFATEIGIKRHNNSIYNKLEMELSELSSYQEASLSCSGLEEWQEGPQVLTYGAILICRKGKARLNVNYKDWELYEGGGDYAVPE